MSSEEIPKEGAGGGEDNSVDLNVLIIITSESQIKQLLLVPQISDSQAQVGLELVPTKTEFVALRKTGIHVGVRCEVKLYLVLIFLFSQTTIYVIDCRGNKSSNSYQKCSIKLFLFLGWKILQFFNFQPL